MNDLFKASNPLMEVMFADDINLFISHKNTDTLFAIMSVQLENSQTSFLLMLIKLNGPYFTLSQKDSFFHRPCLTFLLKILISKENM